MILAQCEYRLDVLFAGRVLHLGLLLPRRASGPLVIALFDDGFAITQERFALSLTSLVPKKPRMFFRIPFVFGVISLLRIGRHGFHEAYSLFRSSLETSISFCTAANNSSSPGRAERSLGDWLRDCRT